MLHNFIKSATSYDIQHKNWGRDLITSYEIGILFSKRGKGGWLYIFFLLECPSRQRTVRPTRMGAYALDILQSCTQKRALRKRVLERMFLWLVFIFYFVMGRFYFLFCSYGSFFRCVAVSMG